MIPSMIFFPSERIINDEFFISIAEMIIDNKNEM